MSDFGYLFLQLFLPSLAYQLPILIVLLVGFILAIMRWRKDPRVSLLTLIAIIIVLAVTIIGTFTSNVLPYILYSNSDMEYSTISIILSVLSVINNLVVTVSWILLLIALFGKRKTKAPVIEP